MTRDTSVEAYHKIIANGLLSRLRAEVYSCIFKNGPITIKEACMLLRHIPETSVSPIFAQLEHREVITTKEKRPCKITGNMAYSWIITDKLPKKLEKKKKQLCLMCGGKGHVYLNN